MFFSEEDRNNLLKMLISSENNKERLIHISGEAHCLTTIVKRLEITIENLANEMEAVKSKMKDLESKFTLPKIIKPQQIPTKKK